MFWLIGVLTTYLLIGLGLAWLLSSAGGEKFKLTKESIPFIFTWPKLVVVMFFVDWGK